MEAFLSSCRSHVRHHNHRRLLLHASAARILRAWNFTTRGEANPSSTRVTRSLSSPHQRGYPIIPMMKYQQSKSYSEETFTKNITWRLGVLEASRRSWLPIRNYITSLQLQNLTKLPNDVCVKSSSSSYWKMRTPEITLSSKESLLDKRGRVWDDYFHDSVKA